MTVTGGTVSWTKIWVVVGFLSTPAFLLIRGSQAIVDKLDVVIVKQDKTDVRMDKFEEKQNAMSIRIDTISHRQEINTLKQDYRFQLQQQHAPVGYIYKEQHVNASGNRTMVR